ncbi:MAG: AAA family ATPase [Planctomycetes bacterium]|nr:AAA family ATPase [Planctomycetota bacterium]
MQNGILHADAIDRARQKLADLPASVLHDNGNGKLFGAALLVAWGFGFDEQLAFDLLMHHFNPRCIPPWSEAEIRKYVRQAITKGGDGPRGHLNNGQWFGSRPTPAVRKPTKSPEVWRGTATYYSTFLTAQARQELADILKLPVTCLNQIELLGYNGDHRAHPGNACWTYPETDGFGNIIGIVQRFRNPVNDDGDNKRAMKGSARGLVLPLGWGVGEGPLVIVEGFGDCLACVAGGIASIARMNKTQLPATVAAMLKAAIEPSARKGLGIIVLADADDAGEDSRAAEIALILSLDFPNVTWAVPPNNAKDAREWLTTRPDDETWPDRGRAFLSSLTLITPAAKPEDEGDGHGDAFEPTETPTAESPPVEPPAKNGVWNPAPIDFADFMKMDFRHEWLVRKLIVMREPCIIFGPSKTLKTSVVIDLVISIATKTQTLNYFDAMSCRRVLLISGESGPASLQSIAARVCDARGIDPETLRGNLAIECSLPPLSDPLALVILRELLAKHRREVVIIDPAYLALLSGGTTSADKASNLFHMGPLLAGLVEACTAAGLTSWPPTRSASRFG